MRRDRSFGFRRSIGLALALPVVAGAQQAARVPVPGAPAGVTAFVEVNVVPMDTERILPHQTVLVEGGRITALGPSRTVKVPMGAVRVDGTGKYLIPGLADMHAHLYQGVATADSIDHAERKLFLFLANGVTTIRNMDYGSPRVLPLRARAAAGELWSPRIYTSGPLYRQDARGRQVREPMPERVAAYQAAGYDFIKIREESRAEFDSLASAARPLGIPFAGHAREFPLEYALQVRYASLEHLHGYVEALLPAGVALQYGTVDSTYWATIRRQLDWSKVPAIAAATQRAGVWNCPTQLLREITAPGQRMDTMVTWPEMRYVPLAERKVQEFTMSGDGGQFLGAARTVLKALQDSGAGLLLGTDASVPYIVYGFSVHRELAAFVRAGLTPYQALRTGTYNVAQFFGTLAESGTVAVGKRADVVLLRGNPLADIRHTAQPAGVMIGGRWLAREEIDRRLAALEASYATTP